MPDLVRARMARIIAAQTLVLKAMEDVSSAGDRVALLLGLLAQEVCGLPPGERPGEVESIVDEFPGIVRAVEGEMRRVLVENARCGDG